MKTDFSPSNKGWSNVAIAAIVTLVFVAFFVLLKGAADQLNENDNTHARCKSVGGEMGYLKCYKNGKEI